MTMRLTAATLVVLLFLSGCSNKSEELQQKVQQLETERAALQQEMADKEKFYGEVVQAVNDVYKDIESVRAQEAVLTRQASGPEGSPATKSPEREQLLANIGSIGATLKENQKKIAALQARAKKLGADIASLNNVIQMLKQTIAEREASIAALEAKVQGLESQVAEQSQTISEKEEIISRQQMMMRTAYYVAGTRDELKKKGIISSEGGFLWGLLGSTTVLNSGVTQKDFTPIDIMNSETIEVNGVIDEIVPARKPAFYAISPAGQKSQLTIKDPERFWQDRYLVVILD